MNTVETEVESLIGHAEHYARFVKDNLFLEVTPSEPHDRSRLANSVMGLARSKPDILFPFQRFVIHFMFPNLTQNQRELIEWVHAFRHGAGDSPEGLTRFKNAKIKTTESELENELSALQLEVLESDYFNFVPPESQP